jgi:hypothetical protein
MSAVTRELLRAFEDCKTGNLNDLDDLIKKGLPIDCTVFPSSNPSCPSLAFLMFPA